MKTKKPGDIWVEYDEVLEKQVYYVEGINCKIYFDNIKSARNFSRIFKPESIIERFKRYISNLYVSIFKTS